MRAISPSVIEPLRARHFAAAHGYTADVGLQQLRADLGGALGDLLAGHRHCAARHHHAARAPGAGRVRRHGGVAVHDLDLADVDAEDFVRDLRQRGLQALAVRLDADAQLKPAVGRQPRGRLLVARHHRDAPAVIDRGAVRGLLAIGRHADADQPAVGFAALLPRAHGIDVDRSDGAAQRFRIVAAVEPFLGDVGERHLLRLHQDLGAHLVRLDAGFARDGVEHELEREADASARDATIRQDRALVGGDRIGAAAIGGKIVRARQDARDLRRLEAGRERIGRIGTGIDGRLAIDADQDGRRGRHSR